MKILTIAPIIVLSILNFTLNSAQYKSDTNKRPMKLINSPIKLEITVPNGNETAVIGSSLLIKWVTYGFKGKINIILRIKRRQVGTIARNLNGTRHSYLWEVGKKLGNRITPGSLYFIEIKDISGQSVDISDNPFIIANDKRLINNNNKREVEYNLNKYKMDYGRYMHLISAMVVNREPFEKIKLKMSGFSKTFYSQMKMAGHKSFLIELKKNIREKAYIKGNNTDKDPQKTIEELMKLIQEEMERIIGMLDTVVKSSDELVDE